MINIHDLINEGYGDIQIKVTLNELKAFADHLIAGQQVSKMPESEEEEMMTRQQVMDYLKIKSTTLFNWKKKGILMPSTVGRKVFYLKSDILALQRGDVSAKV